MLKGNIMKILFVGGTFDDNGGKPSSIVNKFSRELETLEDVEFTVKNGGHYNEIRDILNSVTEYDTVFWWPNIPNDFEKLRGVKEINPKTLLVSSKRNNGEYSFKELINRALLMKANLTIEFSKIDERFKLKLFDPLGNIFYDGFDIPECVKLMIERLKFLKSITRQGTIKLNLPTPEIPNEEEFFNLIRERAEVFHELINPEPGVTRFLGNSSFRCMRGFPSFRGDCDDLIYVSRRNVDKRFIDREAFVPVVLSRDKVYFYGDHKPSVDTPIQVRLYKELPNINYMLHSHVFIDSAPMTDEMIPCGGLEEVDCILRLIDLKYGNRNLDHYKINLLGHGSIIMGKTVPDLDCNYIGRGI